MRRFVILISLLLLGAVIAAASAVGLLLYWGQKPSALSEKVIVQIDAGTGFDGIAERLLYFGVIDYPAGFKLLAYLTSDYAQLKAGEYEFAAHVTPQQVLEQLVEGKSIVHAITFPEGLTSAQMIMLLAQDPRLKGALPERVEEGTLMPDTYHFRRNDDRSTVLSRMQEESRSAMDAIWAKREASLPLKTPEELMILASVVEKETGIASERAIIAGVFFNRLRLGMPLQSDPTVVYGIEKRSGAMNRPLTKKDLAVDHPYNTYLHIGLPPAPICNPGREALEAAAHPEVTDALYFVATGTGGHYFSKTLSEHNQNVARYRAVLRQEQ